MAEEQGPRKPAGGRPPPAEPRSEASPQLRAVPPTSSPSGAPVDSLDPETLDVIEAQLRYGEGDLIADKYRLRQPLGVGGMGEVWEARNEVLDVDVALKLIRADITNVGASDRLLQEARAAARLGHPAIVRVFDFGTAQGGEPFMVMELLKGEDLATGLARRGRLSATRAVRTLLPIVHALGAAHAKGIVHRDVKPENIFLARIEGDLYQPKIVDFGIAQLDTGKNLRLTSTGTLIGTPSYVAPEQARGEHSDHRGDIWSLCVVLYEMVAGRLPFEGKNFNATLNAIVVNDPPPITAFDVGDDALWAIIARGLTKNPDHRFQSMQDLGEALGGWLLSKNVTEDLTGAAITSVWLRAASKSSRPPPPRPMPARARYREATTRFLRLGNSWAKWAFVGSLVLAALLGATISVLRSQDAPAAPSASAASLAKPPAPVVGPAVPVAAQNAAVKNPSSDAGLPSSTSRAPGPGGSGASRPRSVRAVRRTRSAPPVPLTSSGSRVLKDPFH